MARTPVVLVVEDNAELRNVLRDALEDEGYHVLAARDDVDALEVLQRNRVNLLISDLASVGDGTSLEAVKEQFPELRVVALTGPSGGHPALFFGAWQGSSRYRTLTKPFRLRDLLAASRDVLNAIS